MGRPKGSYGKARREAEAKPEPLEVNRDEFLKPEPGTTPMPDASPETTKPAAFPGAEPQSASDTVERIGFKLRPDGSIDFDSLRPSTAEKARNAVQKSIKDDGFKKWAGIAPADAPKIQIVTPMAFGFLLDATAGIEAGVFAKKYGLPVEQVRPIVAWTPADHAMLDAQGANT